MARVLPRRRRALPVPRQRLKRAGGGDIDAAFHEEPVMLNIAVIIGSTRPGRIGESVAKWVYELARKRTDARFELVDIRDFNLPLLDESGPPSMGQYSQEHTRAWAAKVDSFDRYIFV